MASKYGDKITIEEDNKKKRAELEKQLSELYEDYLDADTLPDRETISSRIHNIGVKLLQYEKSTCAINNTSGIMEISTITLKNNMK